MTFASIFGAAVFKSLLLVIALILLNFAFAILIAIKKKNFDINLLPKFLATDIFPYVGSLMLLALLSAYLAELQYIYYGAVGIISIKFGKEALWDKVQQYYSLFQQV